MIGRLSGRLLAKHPPQVLVDVNGVAYEVGVDAIPENPLEMKPHNRVVGDSHYDGLRATDGTDIGSRKKRREYMHRNNLCDADDMKGEWAKAEKQREAMRTPDGQFDTQARREAVIEAMRKARR